MTQNENSSYTAFAEAFAEWADTGTVFPTLQSPSGEFEIDIRSQDVSAKFTESGRVYANTADSYTVTLTAFGKEQQSVSDVPSLKHAKTEAVRLKQQFVGDDG